jgi:RND family efflux transporter MFP subunit
MTMKSDFTPRTDRATRGDRGMACRVAAAGALLAALSGFCGCGQSGAASEQPATGEIDVQVIRPVTRDIPRVITVTGTLHGDEETTLAAKVSGRIVQVMKDLGDVAMPDEPMLQVDPTDYALARDERIRAFREVLAKLGLSELPPDQFDMDQLPAVQRAQLQAANASARLERSRKLLEREPPLISQQDFDDLKTTWEVAESNLQVERLTAASNLANARTLDAQLRIAEQRLLDTVHRAPAAAGEVEASLGASDRMDRPPMIYEVARRLVSVGDFVQVGDPLFQLVDSDPLKLRATLPERRIGEVQVNLPASIRVEAFDHAFPAVVSRISPSVDIATRSFVVELLIENDNGRLKPGSFATAAIEIRLEPALLVPETAVFTFAGVHKVIVVKDSKADERRVMLGDRTDGMVEIRSGLEADALVIKDPTATMTTGTAVRIVEAPRDNDDARGGEAQR